jgi:hypothetical protein
VFFSRFENLLQTTVWRLENAAPFLFLQWELTKSIHWKALEEHVLMLPFVVRFNYFRGGNTFFEFFTKQNKSLKG